MINCCGLLDLIMKSIYYLGVLIDAYGIREKNKCEPEISNDDIIVCRSFLGLEFYVYCKRFIN